MATKKKKSNLSTQQKVGIGVGLTTAAVTAAGAYFLYGSKNAAKNRKMVRSWALKAKAEVLEQLENAQKMSKEEYEELIDRVAAAYGKLREVSKTEVENFRKEMKKHWDEIEKKGSKPAKKSSSSKSKSSKKSSGKKSSGKKSSSKKSSARKK